MSMIINNIKQAYEGLNRYLSQNHFIVILIAILLFVWITKSTKIKKEANRLLVYTLIMLIVLSCPLTAAIAMVYQTSFYNYEWIWSMVPVTIVISYGFVLIWRQEKTKIQRMKLFIVVLGVFCICGNFGRIQRVTPEEGKVRGDSAEVVRVLANIEMQDDFIVWGPREIMQEIRRLDGDVCLVYGRDMWEEKAGAYDYEVYNAELIDAYLWIEKGMEHFELSKKYENPQDALEYVVQYHQWDKEAIDKISNVLQMGGNTIIVPNMLGEYIEEPFERVANEKGIKIQKSYTEDYAIYVMR